MDKQTIACRVFLLGVDVGIRDQLASDLQNRVTIEEAENQQQLLDVLQGQQSGQNVLLIGVNIVEPVRVAQCVNTVSNDVPILILSEADRYDQLKQALQFSPFLGNAVTPWPIDDISGLDAALLDVVQRLQKRRDYQEAMSVSQARLGDIFPGTSNQVTHYLGRVLDNAPIGILNVAISGNILGMNRYAAQILRRTEREVLGLPLTDIFSETETRLLKALIARCVAQTRPPVPEVIDVSESAGAVRYLEVVASSLVDRSGQLGATLILRNVTARICAEQERREAEEALRISERRYRELVQTMSEGLVLTDAQQIITYVNNSFCEMFSSTREELLGKSLVDFVDNYVNEDFFELSVAASREGNPSQKPLEFIAAGDRAAFRQNPDSVSEASATRYEVTWVTASGKRLVTLISQKRIFDPDLGYMGCLGVLTDITERKQIESQEKKHMLELAHMARVTTMGEMSSQLAHELAQPLAAIAGLSTGCLKLFRAGNATEEDIEESLNDISQQAKRARNIVIRLRNFVRNEEVQQTRIKVNDLVQAVMHFIEVEARWHNLSVKLELTETPLIISGDRILLEQVVLNLVHNAIEAMEKIEADQRSLKITTGLNEENRVHIKVCDSGPGMSKAVKAKIFDPFYTTKANGMGMGLAISRSIVNAHKGNMDVRDNTVGTGTVFNVNFPIFDHAKQHSKSSQQAKSSV